MSTYTTRFANGDTISAVVKYTRPGGTCDSCGNARDRVRAANVETLIVVGVSVHDNGGTIYIEYVVDHPDFASVDEGNCYATEAEAQAAADRWTW